MQGEPFWDILFIWLWQSWRRKTYRLYYGKVNLTGWWMMQQMFPQEILSKVPNWLLVFCVADEKGFSVSTSTRWCQTIVRKTGLYPAIPSKTMDGKRSGKLRSYEEIILVLVANPLVLSQLLRNKAIQEKAVNVKDLTCSNWSWMIKAYSIGHAVALEINGMDNYWWMNCSHFSQYLSGASSSKHSLC